MELALQKMKKNPKKSEFFGESRLSKENVQVKYKDTLNAY